MKVAVLGTGPSAAFARQACLDQGIEPDVYGITPNTGGSCGAFHLQWLPPGWATVFREEPVYCTTLGSPEVYYHNTFERYYLSRGETRDHYLPAWNSDLVLPALWQGCKFTQRWFGQDEEIGKLADGYDLVLQTFPTIDSYKRKCKYRVPIYAQSWLVPKEEVRQHRNFIQWIGKRDGMSLLRISWLFGRLSLEWIRPPENGDYRTEYKLWPDCEPETTTVRSNVMLLGRMAQWNPKTLAHHAYFDTISLLSGRAGERERMNAQEYDRQVAKARSLFEKRNEEYGDSVEDNGVLGCAVELQGNIARLRNLVIMDPTHGANHIGQVHDKLLDILNYAAIGLALLEKWNWDGVERIG